MFTQVAFLNVSGSNGLQLVPGLNRPEIAIDLSALNTFVNGDLFEPVLSGGKIFKCRWIQSGVKGNLIPLEYGFHQVLLDVPDPLSEFSLEILPNRYQFEYQVTIYVKVFNPRFNVLAEKLGITLELLQAFPEQTLLFLEGLNLMANADTRQMIAALEATELKANQALQGVTDNATAISTVEGTLVSTQAEMVVSTDFSLESADFLLENGYRVATVTHTLKPGSLQMSLTDYSGDEQGFSQLIGNDVANPNKAKVELTVAQWEGSDFPFKLLLQGLKPSMVSAPVFRLMNGVLSSVINGDDVTQIALLVEWAYLLEGKLQYKLQNQTCFAYDLATMLTASITNSVFDAGANNPLATTVEQSTL